jgi:hypothetical protein
MTDASIFFKASFLRLESKGDTIKNKKKPSQKGAQWRKCTLNSSKFIFKDTHTNCEKNKMTLNSLYYNP